MWMVTLRKVLAILLLLTAAWLGFVLYHQLKMAPQAEAQAEANGWHPFEPTMIQSHVSGGEVVLVDVTADWCLTCQVNKKLVIETPEIRDAFTAHHVYLMRADWTKPDEGIAAYLKTYNRFGIPFNIVHGPGAPDGIILPELLTAGAVKDALEKAAGK